MFYSAIAKPEQIYDKIITDCTNTVTYTEKPSQTCMPFFLYTKVFLTLYINIEKGVIIILNLILEVKVATLWGNKLIFISHKRAQNDNLIN